MNFHTFRDADELRGHLHEMNEEGITPVAVGVDNRNMPFLITLVGPYAESEHVLFDSPWQSGIDWADGHTQCDECRGHVHGTENLRFPVKVVQHEDQDR